MTDARHISSLTGLLIPCIVKIFARLAYMFCSHEPLWSFVNLFSFISYSLRVTRYQESMVIYFLCLYGKADGETTINSRSIEKFEALHYYRDSVQWYKLILILIILRIAEIFANTVSPLFIGTQRLWKLIYWALNRCVFYAKQREISLFLNRALFSMICNNMFVCSTHSMIARLDIVHCIYILPVVITYHDRRYTYHRSTVTPSTDYERWHCHLSTVTVQYLILSGILQLSLLEICFVPGPRFVWKLEQILEGFYYKLFDSACRGKIISVTDFPNKCDYILTVPKNYRYPTNIYHYLRPIIIDCDTLISLDWESNTLLFLRSSVNVYLRNIVSGSRPDV